MMQKRINKVYYAALMDNAEEHAGDKENEQIKSKAYLGGNL